MAIAVNIRKQLEASNEGEFLDKQRMQEALVFLDLEIDELSLEFLGIKKEAAAMQGDYNFCDFDKLVAFSIPAWESDSKGVDRYETRLA
ncbi:hypothetical protein D3C73_1486060 [compost metagenome]